MVYDVIVIGAGPAGCTAAKTLAEKGFHVLLAEKCKLPRYKSCSGVLIKKSLDLIQHYFGEYPPANTTCTPAAQKGMVMFDTHGKQYRFDQDGLNIWRAPFDAWLAQHAAKHGAEIRDGCAAAGCQIQTHSIDVTFQGGRTEQAKYVLDCEGAAGTFKQKCTGSRNGSVMTYQAFYEGSADLDSHYFYAFLQPELSGYDAWFNVKDDQLVCGVSGKNFHMLPGYYQRFLSYLERKYHLVIKGQIRQEKWLMPVIAPGCPITYHDGRIFFAGEAAGFLNPMGEGISAALESGRCAAEAIAGHFANPGQAADEYQTASAGLHTYMLRQWDFVGSYFDTFREMRLNR